MISECNTKALTAVEVSFPVLVSKVWRVGCFLRSLSDFTGVAFECKGVLCDSVEYLTIRILSPKLPSIL